jgi:hypothetical protein
MAHAEIESAIAATERFAGAPAPAFRCTTSGPGERIVPLRHILGQATRAEGLAVLREMLPNAPAGLIAFYERHNGLVLYAGLSQLGSSVCLYPVDEWKSVTRRFNKWKPPARVASTDDPLGVWSGTAIGELVGSGNYFVVPKRGPHSGSVFYVSHDAGSDRPFADSFEKFLLALIDDPPRLLLEHLGGAVSYADGATDQQWSPAEYLVDARTIGAVSDALASASSRARRTNEANLVESVRARATRGTTRPLPSPTAAEIAAAEEALGGSLHPLYARLLREVGNGGFGPGQGVLGVGGGHGDRDGRNALELRELLWPPAARPVGLMPLCEWDDGVWSLLDRESGSVITLDETGFTNTGDDLHAWLEKWLDGVDLYGAMFDARGFARGTRFTPRSRG